MIIPHRKWFYTIGGRRHEHRQPLAFLSIVSGPAGDVAVPGIVEDDFGTAADPRRALATDRRFVSTNDDLGHAGRAA
jgi:hypothetical protein